MAKVQESLSKATRRRRKSTGLWIAFPLLTLMPASVIGQGLVEYALILVLVGNGVPQDY